MNSEDKTTNTPELQAEAKPDSATASEVKTEVQQSGSEPLNVAETGTAALASTDKTAAIPPEVENPLKDLIEKMQQFWQKISSAEQKPKLTYVAIAFLIIPVLILVSTVLNIIDSIPLLAPTLELVGLSYMIWFVFRYLLLANTRQELMGTVKGLKEKVLG